MPELEENDDEEAKGPSTSGLESKAWTQKTVGPAMKRFNSLWFVGDNSQQIVRMGIPDPAFKVFYYSFTLTWFFLSNFSRNFLLLWVWKFSPCLERLENVETRTFLSVFFFLKTSYARMV